MSTRLHIAHLTSVHPPDDPRIFHKQCVSLADSGHSVTLVAAGAVDGLVSGVQVVGVPRPRGRAQRLLATGWCVRRRALRILADVYHVHDPELLPHAVALRRLTGRAVVYDSHEYLGLDILSKPWIPWPLRRPIAATAQLVERAAVRRLSGVIVVNEQMARTFTPVARRIAVVANYPRRDFFGAVPGVTPRSHSVVYAGSLDERVNLRVVRDALSILHGRWPDTYCSVFGEVQVRALQASGVRSQELTRVGMVTCPRVPHDQMAREIAAHAVGWLPWVNDPALAFGTPTKLLEYMAVGRPVVAADLPTIRRIVESTQCGIVVPWNDPRAHAQALESLLADPARAAAMGRNGAHSVASELNWESQLTRLLQLYQACVSEATASPRTGDVPGPESPGTQP